MNELLLQRQIVKDVEAAGGFAKKLSSRTLVGVADLYAKLPEHRGAFIEVKIAPRPKLARRVMVDVTVPQRRFLLAAHRAGDHAMVLSVLVETPYKWLGQAWRIDAFPEDDWAALDGYRELKGKKLAEFLGETLVKWEK